jgi:hypothetical protein
MQDFSAKYKNSRKVHQAPPEPGLKNRYSSSFQIQRNRTSKPTIPSG